MRLLEHPGGQVLASFFGIPLEHVGLLFGALKSELLSAPEVAPTRGRQVALMGRHSSAKMRFGPQ